MLIHSFIHHFLYQVDKRNHVYMLSLSRGIARPLQVRLWQLRVCWAPYIQQRLQSVRLCRYDHVSEVLAVMHCRAVNETYDAETETRTRLWSDGIETRPRRSRPCCTVCACRNGSTLNWRSWHTECWIVWRLRIWTNSFQVSRPPGRRRLRSSFTLQLHVQPYRLSRWQQPAVPRILSQARSIHFLEHSTRWCAVCTVCLLILPASAKDIDVSPVISWHFNLSLIFTSATLC